MIEGVVRAMGVVVVDELAEHFFELAAMEDQHPIEAFTTDGADETLGEGIGSRSPHWSVDDPDAFGAKDLVEARGELSVTIPDQEPDKRSSLRKDETQIPRLLGHPLTYGVRRDSRYVHPPGVQLDEEQYVEPPKQYGLHGKEVASQRGSGLDLQELGPGRTRPLR